MARWTKKRDDIGASAIEYSSLIVLAALVLGGLFVLVPNPVAERTEAALCEIFHLGDAARCQVRKEVATDRCQAFCPTKETPIHPSDPVTSATKGNYVALGDSYASGEGANAGLPYEGTTTVDKCDRSRKAFSEGLRRQFTFKGGSKFVACSGATTDDLKNGKNGEKPQLDALNAHTTTVTLSVGGDDIHFANVMQACMTDAHTSLKFWKSEEDQCHAQRKNLKADMNRLFGHPPNPSRYEQTLEDIHRRSPNARILVSGYPHLFPEPPKTGYDSIRKNDQGFLNAESDELNAQIQLAISAESSKWYGGDTKKMGSFEYVDNSEALKGHELTTAHPWINGVEVCGLLNTNPNCKNGTGGVGTGTFHPTPEGQRSFQRDYARELSEGPGRVLYDP